MPAERESTPGRAELRERAERLWAITVDGGPAPGGARGVLLRPWRRAFARLARPVVDRQRELNDIVLKLVDDLDRDVALARDDRRADELEERLLRLERARATAAAPAASVAVAPPPPFDYFAFEARMRGARDTISARQAVHVAEFEGRAGPVLDAGCGRGEMLRLLADAGIECYGVDASSDMVSFCLGEGLDARVADVVGHLQELEPGALDGIFAGQLVEHLPPPALVRFLELAADRLRPGAPLVAETINPLTLTALTSYFADLTHAQPLVPHTLELLARGAGFASAEIRFLNEPPPEERLRRVELPADAAHASAQRALDLNVTRLNDVLYGPLDYALVARR